MNTNGHGHGRGRVGIVGGGLGGLAAACTLAARGYAVTLLESNAWPGGKAAVRQDGDFRFDMGPTILTLPSVLRRVFQEANRPMDAYLKLIRLDPQWRCFFEDGSKLDLVEDADEMARSLDAFTPGGGAGYRAFLQTSRRLNDISQRHFFYKPIGGLSDMVEWPSLRGSGMVRDVAAMKMGRTVAGLVRSYHPDRRVAQMMDHFTQYVGSNPEWAPAVLCGIADMQVGEGVWYPEGGIVSVPRALSRLALDLGVEIRLKTPVKKVICAGDRACGVLTQQGETLMFDAVVANSDVVRTHSEMMPDDKSRAFLGRKHLEAACSGVVLYLGLKRRYEHLAHHNFVFSRDPGEEFDAIYRRGEPAPDPTCYVAAPSRSDSTAAPEGAEALYVLVHTPYLRPRHNWSRILPLYRQVILQKLRKTAGLTDIESRILSEAVLTPEDIEQRYGVWKGAIYGLASHGRFLGAFKPGNRSPDVRGLYFAGGSVHPGPGMPMALMSGWIAADTLDRDAVAAGGEVQNRNEASREAVAA
ncbi:MAG: phytoene desaturase family protein [Verrucomicrobiota bacterium]